MTFGRCVGTILFALVSSFFSYADDVKFGGIAEETLKPYKAYGVYTNPQHFSDAFNGLTSNVKNLCSLTKAQFIHPVADLPKYRFRLPITRRENEDYKYSSVAMILEELYKRDPKGLTEGRLPEDRLIMSCRYHALLFASILKSQGVPVRLRYGFATYLHPSKNIYHVVSEVWNAEEQRWVLIDPDRQLYDLTHKEFILAGRAWQMYLTNNIDPEHFGVPEWWGAHVILDVLCHDVAAILGAEHPYWIHPPLYSYSSQNISTIPEDEMKIINELSLLSQHPRIDRKKLQAIYEGNNFLKFPESTL